MSVVLDANAPVVLALDRRRAVAVEKLLRAWEADHQDLHAPALLRYEIASALTQAVAAGQLPLAEVAGAWDRITAIPVTLHHLDDALSVVGVAQTLRLGAPTTPSTWRLRRSSAHSCGPSTAGSPVTPNRAGCPSC